MIILLPLGGIGKRFSDEGYTNPKALINVLGKPIIFWVIDCIVKSPSFNKNEDMFVIVYNNYLDYYGFESIISHEYPFIKLVKSIGNTRGAVETIKRGLDGIEIENKESSPIMCIDGDCFYKKDILTEYKNKPNDMKNVVYCFYNNYPDAIYSYICKSDDAIDKDRITEIREKVKISDYANTGCYCFESPALLLQNCNYLLQNDIRQKGEFYTSGVIANMMEHENVNFYANVIDEKDIVVLGTPHQVRIFVNTNKNNENENKMRFCFDLDKTLVTAPSITGDYTTVAPIEKNIKILRYLKMKGHYIIIHTARRMKTYGGNTGKIIADQGEIIQETLRKFEIPYDELYFGKPYADFYIDDLAINANMDLQKQLGFYLNESGDVKERVFNQIIMKENSVCKTSIVTEGHGKLLDGEIYWYQNIPNEIIHLFPKLLSVSEDMKQYTIEKIDGILFSIMYVNKSLTPELLKKLLTTIRLIHNSSAIKTSSKNDELNRILPSLYNNYANKLKERYHQLKDTYFRGKENLESDFRNHNQIYQKIYRMLVKYEEQKRAVIGVIHGDPVFTNIFLDKNHCLKFIDMRGKLGNTCSLYGDIYYDYAKIYQSLCGYDYILLDKPMDKNYMNMMIECFKMSFNDEDIKVIKLITNSLLFSLIPLHNDEKCKEYFKLINID